MSSATQLSPHFTLAEMCRSQRAARDGLDNTPPPAAVAALRALCTTILEPVRAKFGPVHVSSGYRSEAVNAAERGSKTSDHKEGKASDIETATSNLYLARWIAGSKLPFDQCILEFPSSTDPRAGWVHVSHRADGKNRGEVFTATRGADGKTVYTSGLP